MDAPALYTAIGEGKHVLVHVVRLSYRARRYRPPKAVHAGANCRGAHADTMHVPGALLAC